MLSIKTEYGRGMKFVDSKWFSLLVYKPNHFTGKAVSCHGTRDRGAECVVGGGGRA